MTQTGVVTRLLQGGGAEVAVERGTACGGHCDGCETCIYAKRLLIEADNDIYAKPGDRVILESETGSVLGAAAMIYLLPVLLFFAAYAVAAAAGLREGLCVLISLAGAALGGVLAALLGRRRRSPSFRIRGFER